MEAFKTELRTFGNLFFAAYQNETEATEKLQMFNKIIAENPSLLPLVTSEETSKKATEVINIAVNPKMGYLAKAMAIGAIFGQTKKVKK